MYSNFWGCVIDVVEAVSIAGFIFVSVILVASFIDEYRSKHGTKTDL